MPRGDKQHIMTYPIVLPTENELEELMPLLFQLLSRLILTRKFENKRFQHFVRLTKMSGEIDISTIDF